MRIIVNGRNLQLTKAIKDYVTEKFSRLDHHYDFIQEVHVFLSVEKNPSITHKHVAEATIHVNGAVVRVTERNDNLYASIDLLVDKVNRSLNKHKTKLLHRAKSGRSVHGESIRRAMTEEAMAPEEEALLDEELEHIFYTYEEEELESVASGKSAT